VEAGPDAVLLDGLADGNHPDRVAELAGGKLLGQSHPVRLAVPSVLLGLLLGGRPMRTAPIRGVAVGPL
jgi:hypothetical protein